MKSVSFVPKVPSGGNLDLTMLCQRLVIYALTMTSYGHDLMEASTAIFFRSLLCTHEHYSMHAHHRFLPFFFSMSLSFCGD